MTFPLYIQPDAMDCGPTALRMIAKYYGKEFSLDRLREMTFMAKDGVSLFAISQTAEQLGFKTLGGRISFETLEKEALLPCIVHWNQNHFVVVYHIKPKNIFRKQAVVYVADPGKGKLKYTEDEFKQHWISTRSGGENKGIVLLLEPTREFYKQKSDTTNRRSLGFLTDFNTIFCWFCNFIYTLLIFVLQFLGFIE